nr:rRNA maturation RNase YbeY [Desulfobulbaceae bacterium]
MPAIVRSEATRHYGISIKRLIKTADTMLKLCGQASSELSVLLVSDQAMQALNKQYRNKDRPTNVLSFPLRDADEAEDSMSPLGDIVISTDTAALEAQLHKIPVQARLNRLLVHGLIHLLGYDHERSDSEHTIMTNKENELYEHLVQHERRRTMTHLAINVDHVATLRQA